jgi:hypothetical protein
VGDVALGDAPRPLEVAGPEQEGQDRRGEHDDDRFPSERIGVAEAWIAAATLSPSRMMVKRPNRSGRCSGCGGTPCVCGATRNGVTKSIARAASQSPSRREPAAASDEAQSTACRA